jgi:hypothetical protein
VLRADLARRLGDWLGRSTDALTSDPATIARVLIPITDDLAALATQLAGVIAALAPAPAAPPPPAPAPPVAPPTPVRRVVLDGREITLDAVGADAWRVLVDGRPVPMTYRETDATLTDYGTHYKELQPARSVVQLAVPDDGMPWPAFETGRSPTTRSASLHWREPTAAFHNLAIYSSRTLSLRFPLDFATVDVELTHHTDLST